jgi:type VI secretion system protein ImpG
VHALLPYYEHELALLRELAGGFARRYPRIAGRLAAPDDTPGDPHAQRLVQAFALLTARSHKRLDDDLPLFTETLLELLYPHCLRPFPACSIACFGVGEDWTRLERVRLVPRGTLLDARPARGVACRFATTAEAQLLPLRVASAGFQASAALPPGTPLPAGTTALLSLRLELGAGVKNWAALGAAQLRLFLDGEPSLVTLLRETLSARVAATLVQASAQGPWTVDASARPRLVGLEEDEALIPADPRSPPESRLLTEYFAFPEKFNFLDLPLPAAARCCEGRALELCYALAGLGADGDAARLLALVCAANFVTGCVPVINLFPRQAEPIRLTHQTATYTVLPDARAAASHEVYAIDRVSRVRRTAQGLAVQPIAPLYGLRHEELLRDGDAARPCWWTQRDDAVAARSPGHETQIGLADPQWNPAAAQADTLSIALRATNRDLPCRLSIGNPGGDLRSADAAHAGDSAWREIRLLRKPTAPRRVDQRREGLSRLVTQLAVQRQGLAAGGLAALQALLRQHDLPRGAAAQRLMAGLLALELRDAHAAVAGHPFAGTVRGTEVRLSVDEQHFIGSGLYLFAQVLARGLGQQAQLNSFTWLRLLSARTGQVLVDCAPRSGDGELA